VATLCCTDGRPGGTGTIHVTSSQVLCIQQLYSTCMTVGILQYKPIQFGILTNQIAPITGYIVKMPAVACMHACGS
jgi:hypothetical protein